MTNFKPQGSLVPSKSAGIRCEMRPGSKRKQSMIGTQPVGRSVGLIQLYLVSLQQLVGLGEIEVVRIVR